MKAAVWSVLVVLAVSAFSRAEVLIYKGPVRVNLSLDAPLAAPSKINQFFIVDYGANKAANFTFYTLKGKKLFLPAGESDVHISIAQIPKGLTASVITAGVTSFTNPNDYTDQLVFIRGTNTTVKIATNPIDRKINRPRGLIGGSRTGATFGGKFFFIEQSASFLLQAKATIAANNAGKTLSDVVNDLAEEFKKKGYTEVVN